MSEVSIQPATAGDVDVLVDLMAEYYVFDRLPFDAPAARAALQELLHDASLGRLWLVVDGEEPAGYAGLTLGYSLEYHGRDAFLDEFYLRAPYRGRGIGTRVLRFVEEAARSLGVRALHLEVERSNLRAHVLYRNAGFEGHDRHLLTKRLPRTSERPPADALSS